MNWWHSVEQNFQVNSCDINTIFFNALTLCFTLLKLEQFSYQGTCEVESSRVFWGKMD